MNSQNDRILLSLASILYLVFRTGIDYTLRIPKLSPVLGLDTGCVSPSSYITFCQSRNIEANNFSSGSIFRDIDPTTGLGGLENPTQNGTVIDGGFAHLPLIYPALHTLRREYMPYPYKNLSRKLFPRPEFRASDAFTKTEVEKIIRGFKGDFKGFQTYFEGMQVCRIS